MPSLDGRWRAWRLDPDRAHGAARAAKAQAAWPVRVAAIEPKIGDSLTHHHERSRGPSRGGARLLSFWRPLRHAKGGRDNRVDVIPIGLSSPPCKWICLARRKASKLSKRGRRSELTPERPNFGLQGDDSLAEFALSSEGCLQEFRQFGIGRLEAPLQSFEID